MKLKTHYVFSVGLISIILTMLFNLSFFTNLLISFYTSLLGNTIIDGLGHEMRWTKYGYIPRRTPLTHTVPRSIGWGIVAILPLIVLYYSYHYYLYDFIKINQYFIASIIISGLVVGPSHMLLDVFTEKGIYVKRNGVWRRFALAHFSYDNPLVNGFAILVGFLLLLLSYQISFHAYSYSSNFSFT